MIVKHISPTVLRYISAFLVIILVTSLVFIISKQFTSNTLAFITVLGVNIVFSYWINKRFVFENKATNYRDIIHQFLLFLAVLFLNGLLAVLILSALPDSLIILSLILILVLGSCLNYILYRQIFDKISGRKKKSPLFTPSNLKILARKIAINLALCIPIFIFSWGLLHSGHKIIPGDPDYYFQIYEAFRRSVLEFHQLPFWNSWVGGGIPLFANIQFGLISIQSPFILLFGTVVGMKISIIVYQLVAFFGFKHLFRGSFKSSPIKATLLAYIPVFGSFFVDRIAAGHFTFLLIAFAPWLIHFFLNRKKRLYWLYFALIYSFMVWSSPHYMTIMSMVVVGIWLLYENLDKLFGGIRKKSYSLFKENFRLDCLFLLKAGGAIFLLSFYRMFFVVDFIRDFPRNTGLSHENFTGILTGLYAIWGPDQYSNPPKLSSGWGWVEAATYIGIGTLVCFLLIIGVFVYKKIRERETPFDYSPILLLVLFMTFFILGMGNFGVFSPYTVLSHLPIFNSMRVATRWLMWASLFVLFIIAAYKGKLFTKIINIILFITVIELFLSGSHVLSTSYFLKTVQYRSPSSSFNQVYKYDLPRPNYSTDENYLVNYSYDENLFETTRNNLGQVIAGDSLVDTRQPNTTIRCGSNQGNCPLISSNARITYWSPNRIIVERISDGPIIMNINPGKGWLVNGQYLFANDKITDPLETVVLYDTSSTITLQYAPRLSPIWFKTTLKEHI